MFAYLRVRSTPEAIAFYTQAFGAIERFRLVEPSGRVGHAELQLGPSVLMLSDGLPEHGIDAPEPGAVTYSSVHPHVDDADAAAAREVAAGAEMLMPPTDHFYGERGCRLGDPLGHTWLIGHQIEAVTPAEMQRRYTALFSSE